MKKRLVSVALVAALAAGTLAGCGSSSSGDNTQAAAGGETEAKAAALMKTSPFVLHGGAVMKEMRLP